MIPIPNNLALQVLSIFFSIISQLNSTSDIYKKNFLEQEQIWLMMEE